MKYVILSFPLLLYFCFAESLPIEWSQSYCTYDIARVHEPGHYSFGFAVDNFTLYDAERDTIPYDTRRFDLFATLGVLKRTEVELKFSSPTAGVIAGKYQFLTGRADAALKLGFGYMKGTRVGYVTDYVFDMYTTLIVNGRFYKTLGFYIAPKIIYSIHPRDTREHSDREPRNIFQYGWGIGLTVGDNFMIMPESNWLFGDNEGIIYTVNQFGVAVRLRIR